MRAGKVTSDGYVHVEYRQFRRSLPLRAAMRVAGWLCLPLVVPLALISRVSDDLFVTCSQAVALIPYVVGEIVRYQFYRLTLSHCGKNVMIGFGSVFYYRDISIGDNVLVGMFNTVQYCDFGSYVMTADGCRFLSGARGHDFSRLDIPIALQGGKLRRVGIGDDVWIGSNVVVMNDVGSGAVVGAGSVVRLRVPERAIVAGNPCRQIGSRGEAREAPLNGDSVPAGAVP